MTYEELKQGIQYLCVALGTIEEAQMIFLVNMYIVAFIRQVMHNTVYYKSLLSMIVGDYKWYKLTK